ncbi:MAG TPA: hypothetical protein VJ417_08765 [Candidatus Glassbacteria bacterium]|nr:hypothetical protein [Candidatus Glassbacteria bacterium]
MSCRQEREIRQQDSAPEPDAAMARALWPPQQNVWTPLGWKDHLFRFNVLYNGTLLANPDPQRREVTSAWAGLDLQLTVTPSVDNKIPEAAAGEPFQLSDTPDQGLGIQGWQDSVTPVLWTEWRLVQGLVLRQEVFAHLRGGTPVETGTEPLYAWMRLTVANVDGYQAPDSVSFILRLGAVNIRTSMEVENNLRVYPERSAYPRRLTAEPLAPGIALIVREEDGRARLALLPAEGVSAEFVRREPPTTGKSKPGPGSDYYLIVTLPASQGAYADLLVPMLPAERGELEEEISLGRAGALAECERFWSAAPEFAARIITPETQLNQALSRSLQFAEIIAEKNPYTKEYSFLSGAWTYARLWPTPTSMVSHMLLDNLGYHEAVARHLEIFRLNQGTVTPPGESYELHPGYYSAPKSLTSIDWLADHGAILYEVSRHALLTGDRQFIDRWLESIIRACEFIRDARARIGHGGVEGVLPPAVATDRRVSTQSVWSVGWNYKGLSEAVRLLERLNDPRAGEFAKEAADYRVKFVAALRQATAVMPAWTDRSGQNRRLVPFSLSAGGDITHAFYLDAGPLFLVWSGLLSADDELMKNTLAYFREGPNTALYDSRGNCWQRPVLIHEISSCEPCYSWNVYHSWQLGDRYHYLEGLYSLLAGALSDQTYISCETRHGIYGNVFASPLLADLVRLAVIDDRIAQGELHLLRLTPLAWLREGFETVFENMPTEFGPLTLAFQSTEQGRLLKVKFEPRYRSRPERVMLHLPPLPGLERVEVNGKEFKAVPGSSFEIPLDGI